VLGALGKAAIRIRERLGESLSSIKKFDTPIEQATTASLEALKAYSVGKRLQTEAGDGEALPSFKQPPSSIPTLRWRMRTPGLSMEISAR